jgi:hypothetical protein
MALTIKRRAKPKKNMQPTELRTHQVEIALTDAQAKMVHDLNKQVEILQAKSNTVLELAIAEAGKPVGMGCSYSLDPSGTKIVGTVPGDPPS